MFDKDFQVRINGIKRLLELIADVNKDIESSKKVKSNLMARQYEHLKKQYTKELLGLLEDYQLPLQMAEVA